MTRPNLLFVFPDEWRRQALGFLHQDPVLTPHLDAFAAQSRVLTHAVSNFPVLSSDKLTPGTFFVPANADDARSGGSVTLMPPAGTDRKTAVVEVAVRPSLLATENQRNVVLRGLAFQHASTDTVTFRRHQSLGNKGTGMWMDTNNVNTRIEDMVSHQYAADTFYPTLRSENNIFWAGGAPVTFLMGQRNPSGKTDEKSSGGEDIKQVKGARAVPVPLSVWQRESGQDKTSRIADPKFKDPRNGDSSRRPDAKGGRAQREAPLNRPNILYIHSHDTGRFIQPYGHAIPTPRLQKLAEDGVLFRQAFSAAPTCCPSRTALLTGQAPHSAGMFGQTGRGFSMRDPRQHLVHTLRAAGYVSAQCGVQHVALDPHSVGYDFVLSHEGASEVRNVTPAVAEWIRQAPADQPFFLAVGFVETHRYMREPESGAFTIDGPHGDARYVLPPAPLPDTPATRQDMADFIQSARILDDGVAQVLDALDANGLLENTLVISTTDHGIAFPDMKCNLLDGGLGVSLIMAGPGGFEGGKVVDALVSHIDVFPTLCELLEIERPVWLQGHSLLPLVRGETSAINEAIFGEVTFHGLYDPQRCARTPRWKYIRRFEDYPAPGQAVSGNTDMGPSKTLWLEHGWRERHYAREQLYDLVFDPNEANNLADSPTHAAVLDEMRAHLERWMRATGDPLLDGPVPLPPGVPQVFNEDGILRGLPFKSAAKSA